LTVKGLTDNLLLTVSLLKAVEMLMFKIACYIKSNRLFVYLLWSWNLVVLIGQISKCNRAQ